MGVQQLGHLARRQLRNVHAELTFTHAADLARAIARLFPPAPRVRAWWGSSGPSQVWTSPVTLLTLLNAKQQNSCLRIQVQWARHSTTLGGWQFIRTLGLRLGR